MKRRLFAESRILHRLDRITGGLYDAAAKSAVGRALTAYDAEKKDASRSLVATRLGRAFSKIDLARMRLFFARKTEQSVIVDFIRRLMCRFASSYMRQYGVFLLAFGFYGALMYLLTNYTVRIMRPLPFYYLLLDVGAVFLALPMLGIKRTLAEVVCKSRLANYLFFNLLGLRRESLAEYGRGEKRVNFSFAIGTLFGILTLFVSPYKMVCAALLLITAYLVICSPETGVVLTALFIPFAPTAFLGFFIMFTTVSYVLKVLRGKRTLSLDLKDWAVLLLAAVVLLGGLVSIDVRSSFSYAVKMVFYMFSYILCVNLVCSRKWLGRVKTAIIISCVVTALGGLVQKLAISSPHFISEELTHGFGITSFFATESALSEYLIFGLFFVIAELMANTHKIRKVFLLVLCVAIVTCVWFAGYSPAMFACIIAAFIFFMIYSHRTLIVLLGGVIAVPALHSLMPLGLYPVMQKIYDGVAFHIVDKSALWRSSGEIAREYMIGGIGLGGYRTVFSRYANENVSFALNSSNLYIQTIIDIGVFGLILFLCVVLLFAQHSFGMFATRCGGKRTLDTAAGFAGIIAIMLCGFAGYVWADEKIFLCFWLIMGVSAAAGNVAVENDRGKDRYLDIN